MVGARVQKVRNPSSHVDKLVPVHFCAASVAEVLILECADLVDVVRHAFLGSALHQLCLGWPSGEILTVATK